MNRLYIGFQFINIGMNIVFDYLNSKPMNTLKRNLLILFTAFIAFGSGELYGQRAMRIKAHRVIRRTAVIILAAHKNVKEGKVYTGDLARSIAHQKFARSLYRRGMFVRAIHHSRRARLLAVMAIKANKGADVAEAKADAEEEELMKNSPSDDELEKELLKEMPNEKMKDEDVVGTLPDIDLKDKE